MMLYFMEVNNIVFRASCIDGMLVVVDFLLHLREQEDQQGEQG